MIVCNRCDCEIKNGDEYKVAYEEIWCIECAEDVEGMEDSLGYTEKCPHCEGIDDDQYTCTYCWCQGGNGKKNLLEKYRPS